jgi:hypothetical protein
MKRLFVALAALAALAVPPMLRAVLPVAAVAVVASPGVARADDTSPLPDGGALFVTSSSGASGSVALPFHGAPISVQSQTCAFHYRVCNYSGTCTAVQTDYYVELKQGFDIPLTGDAQTFAVACDGTSSGTVNVYRNRLP